MSNSQQQNDHTKVGQAINGFAEMNMERIGGTQYRVLTWRNGSLRVHQVNTCDVTCTCEDFEYNVNDGDMEVCDHIAYAVYHAPKDRDVDQEAFLNLIGVLSEMNDYKNALEQRRNQMDSADAESAETNDRPSLEETTPEPTHDPQEKAEELQQAFDGVVEDMQVKAAAGKVWFQTGRDTPEDWPFPGAGSTFEAVTGPDVVEYVYEGDDGPDHEWYDEKPGEWWKNAIRPSDVEQYISEVLE